MTFAAALPAAPTAAPAARLDVTVGDVGDFIPGRPVPVRVAIRSDRLIAGQLVLTAGSFQLAQPVEVAGGSNKQYELVVPTAYGLSQLQAEVTVTEGGHVVASSVAAANPAPDTEVVGVLPELLVGRSLSGPAPLSVDAGTARFVAVSDQDLALAPASLGPLTAVAVGPDGLSHLSTDVRRALLAWTGAGGRLLIDAQPGDTVTGLPSGWHPSGSSRASAGLGEVVLTGGAMAAGRWDGLVDPASHTAGVANPSGFNGTPFLSSALAGEAGVKTPRLEWLIGFLLLYVLLVGPISFLVLRRLRRPELLWAVIPVVALAFAGSGYVVASTTRSHVRVVHGTIVDTTVAGGTALSYIGVLSGGQGTTRFDAPPGWVMQRYNDPQSPVPSSASLKASATSQGIQGKVGLDAGQFALVEAGGPAGFNGQLAVTAHSTADGRAEGTVTNETPYPLRDVLITIGGAAAAVVGTLAPGARTTWSSSTGGSSGSGPGANVSIETQMWGFSGPQACALPVGPIGGFVGPGVVVPSCSSGGSGGIAGGSTAGSDAGASLPLWVAGPIGLAPATRNTGVAVAVGWTSGYKPPISVVGQGRPSKGHTAIVGTTPVQPLEPVTELAIRRQVVRGNPTQVGPGAFIDTTNGGQRTTVGWQLPPAASGHRLSLTIPGGTGDVDVWSERTWRRLISGASNSTGSSGPVSSFPPFPAPFPGGTIPPNVAFVPPGPAGVATTTPSSSALPIPLTTLPSPVAPPGFGPTTVTTSVLGAGDVDRGAVYVRLSPSGFNQPFDLDALRLTVVP